MFPNIFCRKVADIRPATTADVQRIMRIEESQPSPWPQKQVVGAICHCDYQTLFVCDGKYPIGWLTARLIPGGVRIKRIAVEPMSRRLGYGRSMLEDLAFHAPGVHECEFPFQPEFDVTVIFLSRCGFRGRSVTRLGQSFIQFTKGK